MSVVRGTFWSALKNSAIFRGLIILECCVLLILTLNCLRGCCDYIFTSDNLFTPSGLGEWIGDEAGTGYLVSSDEALGDNIILNTDFFVLYPGSYSVKATYTSQASYSAETDYTVGTAYLHLNSDHNDIYYHFDSILLRDGLKSVDQTVQVTSPWKISDFQITISYSGQGSLMVYSIEITENAAYKYLVLLGGAVFFFLLDLFCYLMFMGSGFPYIKELGVLTLIGVAACLPFLTDWIFAGEDSSFWAARLRLLAQELSTGNYFSSVHSILRDSSGYTAASAYGSLFLYLPAILFNCGFSLTFVYNFYICVLTVATCLITYYCALRIFGKSNLALLASALYTLSAPRLTCILTLASLGEMTAMTFLPLILLGFYEIYSSPEGEKIHASKYVPAVLGLTGVINSYVPEMWMTGMLIIILCILLFRRNMQLPRLAALVKTAALTVLVNLALVLSGISAFGKVSYEENISQTSGVYLVQVFNSIVNNDQSQGVAGNYVSGQISMSIGFSVTLGLVLFVIHTVKKKQTPGCNVERESSRFAVFCWGMALFTIFLSSVYMFFDYMDFLPENLIFVLSGGIARSRWLPFAVLFGIFCTCETADSSQLKEIFQGVPVILLICMALTLNTGQIYSDQLRTSPMERLSNSLYENLDSLDATEAYILYVSEMED